jgi:hypothetical protein
MNENLADLPVLHEPLTAILHAELDFGNQINEVQLGGWSEVDVVVSLKFPFHKDYREEFPDVTFHRNVDTHYSLSDSYSINREAVEAPY